ncbi:hypothetical protein GW931_02610 [archaeon]|nr:hypothetical protein [archaeon]
MNIKNSPKKIDSWIKAIVIIYYIYFGISILTLIEGILTGNLTLIAFGIIFGMISFFVARGLSKKKEWARITIIILASLELLGHIYSILNGNSWHLFGVALNGFIWSYLLLNKKVIKQFI